MGKNLNISNFIPWDEDLDTDYYEPVIYNLDWSEEPTSYEGRSICLFRLIECKECGIFIVEPKDDKLYPETTINLGRSRKLNVKTNSVLAFIYPDRVKFRALPLKEGEEFALIPHLKNIGLEAKSATGIFKGHQVAIRRHTWVDALDIYYGIFTGNGLAVFDSGWFDCFTFSMYVYYKAPILKINGQLIRQITVDFICREFDNKVREVIKKSLLGKHNKTLKELQELVKKLGYEEEYRYLKIIDKNGEIIRRA